ncbi:hypothetical protein ROHU_010330 [Labeo rohita]|uniref:Uncharacterized protein n=1 Tax=Labeo rohita TaxID=84645 RepID=A0A498LXT2_LABRO|nr:hypothetical protein ROHU_010330 [Labeo rohita]
MRADVICSGSDESVENASPEPPPPDPGGLPSAHGLSWSHPQAGQDSSGPSRLCKLARKTAATNDTNTSFEVASTARSEGFSHNQQIEDENINMLSDTVQKSSESEADMAPTLKEELSEWASMFQDYLCYVVLHFIEHNEVEVAPSKWLEWVNEIVMIWQDYGHKKLKKPHMLKTLMGMVGRKVIPPIRFREEEVQPSQPRWAKQSQRSHENSESSEGEFIVVCPYTTKTVF